MAGLLTIAENELTIAENELTIAEKNLKTSSSAHIY
jgi:hypothetical protein